MATTPRLESIRPKQPANTSPLTRELKEFIDHAIVPALVKQYLADADADSRLAKGTSDAAHSVRNTAAPELRTMRP